MTCVHHWVLGPGTVNVSGRCRKCGSEREFAGGVPFNEVQSYSHKARPFNTSMAQATRARAQEALRKKQHGTNGMYKSGCRCAPCKAAKSVISAAYRARREIAS